MAIRQLHTYIHLLIYCLPNDKAQMNEMRQTSDEPNNSSSARKTTTRFIIIIIYVVYSRLNPLVCCHRVACSFFCFHLEKLHRWHRRHSHIVQKLSAQQLIERCTEHSISEKLWIFAPSVTSWTRNVIYTITIWFTIRGHNVRLSYLICAKAFAAKTERKSRKMKTKRSTTETLFDHKFAFK